MGQLSDMVGQRLIEESLSGVSFLQTTNVPMGEALRIADEINFALAEACRALNRYSSEVQS